MLEYLQGIDMCHRDLKLENIMVTPALKLRLIDFGFATLGQNELQRDYRGTQSYMAPEIIEGKPYFGGKADLFSFAVIMFTLVTAHFPFAKATRSDPHFKYVYEGKKTQYFQKSRAHNLSPEFKDLFWTLICPDGSKRPTLQWVKAHPWFSDPKDNEITAKKSIHEQSAGLFSEMPGDLQNDEDTQMTEICPVEEYQLYYVASHNTFSHHIKS